MNDELPHVSVLHGYAILRPGQTFRVEGIESLCPKPPTIDWSFYLYLAAIAVLALGIVCAGVFFRDGFICGMGGYLFGFAAVMAARIAYEDWRARRR